MWDNGKTVSIFANSKTKEVCYLTSKEAMLETYEDVNVIKERKVIKQKINVKAVINWFLFWR